MDVRLSLTARMYMRREAAYLRARNAAAAEDFGRRMKRALRDLADFPYAGARTDPALIPGRRRLVVGNYLVDYEVVAEQVRVQTIRHGRRQPPEQVNSNDDEEHP